MYIQTYINHIGGVISSMFSLSVVDHGFKPPFVKAKDYEIKEQKQRLTGSKSE